MKPTTSVLGAIRLRLTTKKANKDYYKGTRQAFVPGTNVRTGRPGAFSKSGSEFRVDDNKVRFYVAPPMGLLDKTDLKPYVEKSAISDKTPQKTAPFQPHAKYSISTEEYRAMKFNSPEQKAAYKLRKREHLEFAAKYRALSADQREALKMQARREWWESFNL